MASAQAYWTDSGPMQKLQATPDCLGLNVPTRSDECELATQHSMNSMGLELQSSGLPTAIRISKLHLFNHADGIDARAACSVHRSSNTGRIGSSERATLLLSPSSIPPVSKNTFLWDDRGKRASTARNCCAHWQSTIGAHNASGSLRLRLCALSLPGPPFTPEICNPGQSRESEEPTWEGTR